jgi:hypothetical protein
MLADDLMTKHDAMKARRSNWDHLWERVARLVLPRLDDFSSKRAPGEQRNFQQYDAFPMGALDKFAAAIEAGLMPRTTLWHHLITGDEDLDEDHTVKVFLEGLNKILWDARYSPTSNFASQAHEKRISLGAFGTGCMLVEPREGGGVRYRTIHLSEVTIASNHEGMIDTVHRDFMLTARQAVQLFRDKTPAKVMQEYNRGAIHKEFQFLHCVGPREDYDAGRLDQLPFIGYYVFLDGREVVKEDGHHEQPYIVTRYSVSPREDYGRSPAIQLLPDISMLNEMKYVTIEAANMAIDPPRLSADGVSEYDLQPGTDNPGTLDDNGRPRVLAWQSGTRPDIALELMRDVRNQIDDGFMGVYFRVLLENPQMTATQAMLIAQQQGQMTAPVIGRMQSEWLGPLIRRESGILYRQGKHPPMPQVLADWLADTGKTLQIEYQSPMTRAAQSEEAVGILRAFETLAPLAQIDPSVYQQFDIGEIARIVSKVNGVPAKALKSPETLATEAEAKQAQAALGDILGAAPIAAQTAKTLSDIQMSGQRAPV